MVMEMEQPAKQTSGEGEEGHSKDSLVHKTKNPSSHSALLQGLQRDINCLGDENRTTRRRALTKITKTLLGEEGGVAQQRHEVTKAFPHILKPLLKLFADPVEKCRELAIGFVSESIPLLLEGAELEDTERGMEGVIACGGEVTEGERGVTVLHDSLPYIVPVIVSRLTPENYTTEPSEELRLALMVVLQRIVATFPTPPPKNPYPSSEGEGAKRPKPVGSVLDMYVGDFLAICGRGLMDPYPEVKRTTCLLLEAFVPRVERRFYSEGKVLVQPLQVALQHQHSRVRAFTVRAIGCVVKYGEVTIIDDFLTTLGQLLFDNGVTVRRALCEVVGEWLQVLVDRYSYHHKLLPLLVALFSDEVDEVAELARNYLDCIGEQYQKENESDLKEQIDYAVALPQQMLDRIKMERDGRDRPSLGCRVLMSRCLSKMLPAIIADLTDWTVFRRRKAGHLLLEMLFYGEDYLTQHLDLILNGMYKAAQDEEEEVRMTTYKCGRVLGMYVHPDALLNIITPHFSIYSGAANVMSAVLTILAYVIDGLPREKLANGSNLERVCNLLVDKEFLHSEHTQLLWALALTVSSVAKVCGSDCKPFTFQLCEVLLHCQSLAGNSKDAALREKCMETASTLFRECYGSEEEWRDVPSEYGLFGVHFQQLLGELKGSLGTWTKHSSERILFENLLECSGPYAGKNLEDITAILKSVFDSEKDPDMRLSFFTLLCRLLSAPENPLNSAGELPQFAESFIVDMIMPNLVWRSGRTASAIRTAAVSTLWAVLKTESLDIRQINNGRLVIDIFPQLKSALDDDNASTRLVVCSVFQEIFRVFGRSIDPDLLHAFYDDLLKRMDDNRDEIRVAITKTFYAYLDCLPTPYDKVLYSAHLTAMSRGLLVHLDDPESHIQEAVLMVLKKLCLLDAENVLSGVESVRHKHRTPLYCDQLAAACKEQLQQGN
eukprot:Nk52_evm12s2118 gene=Nk52_evmTU12s2118